MGIDEAPSSPLSLPAVEFSSGVDASHADLLARWRAHRAAAEYAEADAILAVMQAAGLDPWAQYGGRCGPRPKAGPPLGSAAWEVRIRLYERYPSDWAARVRRMISPEGYLAQCLGWATVPRIGRCIGIPRAQRDGVGEVLGRRLRDAMSLAGDEGDKANQEMSVAKLGKPQASPLRVLYVELPFLRGFVEGFGAASISDGGEDVRSPPPPFVLLLTTYDRPVSPEMTECLGRLPTMVACFATNLLRPTNPDLFRPLPLGLALNRVHRAGARTMEAEELIGAVHQTPWAERDQRLLVTPMRAQGRLRARYLEVLARPEYRDLVLIFKGPRLSPTEFLALVARHRCVLSPPGRGYDCFRTWEALGLGTVPLVVHDEAFDPRLFENTGAAYIPRPEALTPALLKALLLGLEDPVPQAACLQLSYWRQLWESMTAGASRV